MSVSELKVPDTLAVGNTIRLNLSATLTGGTRQYMDNKGSDKRKQSLYFPESMLQEIKDEAVRLDRSLSWIVQRAWKVSRAEIRKIPSVNDVDGGDDSDSDSDND